MAVFNVSFSAHYPDLVVIRSNFCLNFFYQHLFRSRIFSRAPFTLKFRHFAPSIWILQAFDSRMPGFNVWFLAHIFAQIFSRHKFNMNFRCGIYKRLNKSVQGFTLSFLADYQILRSSVGLLNENFAQTIFTIFHHQEDLLEIV